MLGALADRLSEKEDAGEEGQGMSASAFMAQATGGRGLPEVGNQRVRN